MHWLTKLVHWCVHHQQEIQSIAPLATMISAICAAVGILVAVITLIRTNKQLSLARQSLAATTLYNIQKDGRELISAIRNDPELSDYFKTYDENRTYSPELLRNAKRRISEVIQYYSSLYNQHRLGVIPEVFWDTIADEIRRFLNEFPVKTVWKETVGKGNYNKEFEKFCDDSLK